MLDRGPRAFENAVRLEPAARERESAVVRISFSLVVAAGELALVAAWLMGSITAAQMCGLHVAGCFLFICAPAVARRSFSAAVPWDILTVVLLGPLGAGLLTASLPSAAHRRRGFRGAGPESETSGADVRAELLVSAIRQRRRVLEAAGPVAPFSETFVHGDRAAQNAALRAISRHYRPDMLPALLHALGSESPAVRVQAAAVYSKLRGNYAARARALLAAGGVSMDAAEAESRAAALREVAKCGFVDAATSDSLTSLAARLDACAKSLRLRGQRSAVVEQLIANLPDSRFQEQQPLIAPPRLKRHACGGLG